MMRTSFIGAGLISLLCSLSAQAQTPGPGGICDRNPDVCSGLRGSGADDSGGIGSRKGTGGEGTNALRPADGLNVPKTPNITVPRLPNVPRRF
ncbi:hypothetical protein [Bradyrhizobium sp. BR 1433]|uniref:hypothetical protein n=1 Tax=Bradyrhizobium sp. BR 1433 TaxID=3447967 RepID=UPI003EE5D4AC